MQVIRFLVPIAGMLLQGCATVSYYTQAAAGQLDLLSRSRPIDELLDDPPTPPQLRKRLETVLRVRAFAANQLKLPDNGSYTMYAELDRPAVAWNVVATPALDLTPREWCFPFAGCVPYRGFFERKRAEHEAALLRSEGLDVRISPVSAYSTLGWFRDPVLSTQLRSDDTTLAGLIFHELAHQQLYVPGDATFNESFATTVEIEGLQRWLQQEHNSRALEKAMLDLRRREEFAEFLLRFRSRLQSVYASGDSDEAKIAAKARIFEELRAAWPALKSRWGGDFGYESWFTQSLNNAHLASVGLYHEFVPAFTALLREKHDDLAAFYQEAREISRLEPEARRARLAGLMPARWANEEGALSKKERPQTARPSSPEE